MNKNLSRMLPPILTVLFIASIILFVISFSIGLPIWGREFYYMQIGPLGLEEACGRDREVIVAGYDEVLDFLTRPGGSFSAGDFRFSESGADHFKDCKALFALDAIVYIVTALVISTLLMLIRFRKIKLCRPLGFAPSFWSGAITLLGFATLGALVLADFDTAFKVFHGIFFPGKDNWLFNPYRDEIILAMPEEFFMNCALLIGSSVIILSLVLVLHGIIRKEREKSRS